MIRSQNASCILLRTHIDKENFGIGTFINENALTAADFNANKESTEELYGAMNLLGSCMGIMTDSTYTVADCVKPMFKDSLVKAKPHNKERVLVETGIEEHYFPRLPKVAIDRINSRFPGQYIAENTKVCATYTKLILGTGAISENVEEHPRFRHQYRRPEGRYPQSWRKLKEDYTTHFIEIADRWHEACERYPLPDAKPGAPAPAKVQEPGRLTL